MRSLLRQKRVLASVALGIGAASVVAVLLLADRKSSNHPRPDPVLGKRSVKPANRQSTLSLTWVGDISLSSSHGLPPDPEQLLSASVTRRLSANELTIGNLEGTLGSGGGSKCAGDAQNCFAFQAPSRYARSLKGAGFDVMNLANNHAFDFGAGGQRQTIAALKRERLGYAGRPGQVLIRRAASLRIAFVGFAPYPWAAELRDIEAARRLVRRADRMADIVAVLMHAGAEGADQTHTPRGVEVAFGENRGDTRGFAHAVVRAGADLVLGSGPHVVRGIERYRGRLIAYSLGNFLGYHTFSLGGTLSLSGILTVKLAASGRARGGRWISLRLGGAGVPGLDASRESARLVRSLSMQDFGRTAYPMTSRGSLGE